MANIQQTPDQRFFEKVKNFPKNLYKVDDRNTFLFKFLYSILEGGVGQLKGMQDLAGQSQSSLANTEGADLDEFFQIFGIKRDPKSIYNGSLYSEVSVDSLEEFKASDAKFRTAIAKVLQALQKGGTVEGLRLMAEAASSYHVQVIEPWRYQTQYARLPNYINETVIIVIPDTELTEEEKQSIKTRVIDSLEMIRPTGMLLTVEVIDPPAVPTTGLATTWEVNYDTQHGPNNGLFKVAYGDGRWVALGRAHNDTKNLILSTTDLEAGWEYHAFNTGSQTIKSGLWDVAYGDGIWTAVGGASNSSKIAVYTSTNPLDGWTQLQIDEPGGDVTGYDYGTNVDFDGTTWAFITSNGRVYTATDPTDTWTLNQDFRATETVVDSPSVYYPYRGRLRYLNNNWVTSFAVNGVVQIWSTEDFVTWTEGSTFTTDYGYGTNNIIDFMDLGYSPEGYFLSTGYEVWSSEELDGIWTKKVDFNDYELGESFDTICGFAYGDGRYVILGNYTVDYPWEFRALQADTISGPYTPVGLTSSHFEDYPVRPFYSAEGGWIAVGAYWDDNLGEAFAAVWTWVPGTVATQTVDSNPYAAAGAFTFLSDGRNQYVELLSQEKEIEINSFVVEATPFIVDNRYSTLIGSLLSDGDLDNSLVVREVLNPETPVFFALLTDREDSEVVLAYNRFSFEQDGETLFVYEVARAQLGTAQINWNEKNDVTVQTNLTKSVGASSDDSGEAPEVKPIPVADSPDNYPEGKSTGDPTKWDQDGNYIYEWSSQEEFEAWFLSQIQNSGGEIVSDGYYKMPMVTTLTSGETLIAALNPSGKILRPVVRPKKNNG